jgi:hypothetical protein
VDRLQRFLFSRRNLVGVGLAAVGLVLYLAGPLAATGPFWLTIVVGLYFLGVIVTPKERGPKVRLDPAADTESIRDGLAELERQIRFKVADDILGKVESIRKTILDTLVQAPDRDAGNPTIFLIRQTALDYLPSALSAYLELPRLYAERRAVVNGRTPHDVLLEQLNLMDTKMREAADAILVHDSEKLQANGRFLADRFGTSSLRLDGTAVPAEAPVPAPAASESVASAETESTTTADEHERVR